MVRDPAHPLYGRRFRVVRRIANRGGNFPRSYEVEHGDETTLLIPVAATESRDPAENPTKLSVEALRDLISTAEQFFGDGDRSTRCLDDDAADAAATGDRRDRRGSRGDDA